MSSVTLINPRLVTQKGDYFGSGIPYWPITLAYIAGELYKHNIDYDVVDLFGENPKRVIETKDSYIQGIDYPKIDADVLIIYAGLIANHSEIIRTIKHYKDKYIIIVANIHLVTAYPLGPIAIDFIEAGAKTVICGEPEHTIINILKNKEKYQFTTNHPKPDKHPSFFANWTKFPIGNYWKLGYAHAPYIKPYFPILTSRGCNNHCKFCISPYIHKGKHRKIPESIVSNEILAYYFSGIREIHICDLNPTLNHDLIVSLMQQYKNIDFKFPTGTKLETIPFNSPILTLGNCKYLSFSPESGSKRILDLMNKHFDFEHGLKMTRKMHKNKVYSQACFVVGFPGENDKDRLLTREYIKKLTINGLDEIALFIFAPIPGAEEYSTRIWKYNNLSQLTFSPTWRKEYKQLDKWRRSTYLLFFFWKFKYHPIKLFKQILELLSKNFKTKTMMTIYRKIKVKQWQNS